jgi:hypothetical protein
MIQNQSGTILQRLVVVEQEDGKDLIAYPIPGSLTYGQIGDTRQWGIEVSVYGYVERSTVRVQEFEDPELRIIPLAGLSVSLYAELEKEIRQRDSEEYSRRKDGYIEMYEI